MDGSLVGRSESEIDVVLQGTRVRDVGIRIVKKTKSFGSEISELRYPRARKAASAVGIFIRTACRLRGTKLIITSLINYHEVASRKAEAKFW